MQQPKRGGLISGVPGGLGAPGAGRKVERRMLDGFSWSDDYKQPSDWSGLHVALIPMEVAGLLFIKGVS